MRVANPDDVGCLQKFLIINFVLMGTFIQGRVDAVTDSEAADLARRLFVRLNGARPSSAALNAMKAQILVNRGDLAAFIAMNDSRQTFYKSKLPELFSPWKSLDAETSTALDDYSATIVGLVINNQRFDEIVYGDVMYAAPENLSLFNVDTAVENGGQPEVSVPAPVRYNNNPFVQDDIDIDTNNDDYPYPPEGKVRPIFQRNVNNNTNPPIITHTYTSDSHYRHLSRITNWPSLLTRYSQTSMFSNLTGFYQLSSQNVAGLLTLQTAGRGYFDAGTNRRPIRWMFERLLGVPLETLHDPTRPDTYVRRDVDRVPGGNPATYASCRGCHAGMDGLVNAFAPFNFASSTLYNMSNLNGAPNGFFKIYRQFNTFPQGFLPNTTNGTTWYNLWTEGQKANLGWRLPSGVSSLTTGTGVNSLMKVIAATEAFGNNMAKISFQLVCGRDPVSQEWPLVVALARQFEQGFPSYASQSAAGPYNLRALIARMAPFCFGENL